MNMTKNIDPDNKENRVNKDKKNLVFAVPGGKVYINDYYTNSPGSFLNISITGQDCKLMCRHCRKELLKGMLKADNSKKLVKLVEKYIRKGRENSENSSNESLKGMLISGGFDTEGKLPVNDILSGVRELKLKYPFLTIYIHAGFLNEDEAASLKSSGVDAVLVNLIGSQTAISETYNLKNRTYSDYLDTIKLLKGHGLKVSPHIIIGLENGKISDEFKTVRDALALEVDSLVFIVLKKASRTIDYVSSKVPHADIIRLVKYARGLSGDVLLSFGCAKPSGNSRHLLEISLIKAGIDSIAFPAEETIRFAVKNKIAHTFLEKCCAIL
jgi:lipoyl synthase